MLREEVEDVKGWATGCLQNAKTGPHKGGGKKKTTLRLIELSPVPRPGDGTLLRFRLGSVKVEEYEV